MEMAHDADARRDLVIADYERAYPENEAVLRDLLSARHRKAELLGLASFADVATQRMMMPNGDAIGEFIDEVNAAARPAASPIAQQAPTTRAEAWAQRSAERHLPTAQKFSTSGTRSDDMGIS